MSGVFDALLSDVSQLVNAFIEDGYQSMLDALTPTATALLTVYIIAIGYDALLGRQELTLSLLVRKILFAVTVYALFLNYANFQVWVVSLLENAPNQLSTVLLHASGHFTSNDSVESVLSETFDQGIALGTALMKKALSFAIAPMIGGLLCYVSTFISVCYALIIVIRSQLIFALLMALAPLFGPLILFTSTRGIWEQWLRSLLSSAMTPMMIYAVCALFLSLMQTQLNAVNEAILSNQWTLSTVWGYGICALTMLLLFLRAGSIAHGIFSGVTASVVEMAGRYMGREGAMELARNIKAISARGVALSREAASVTKALTSSGVAGYNTIRQRV